MLKHVAIVKKKDFNKDRSIRMNQYFQLIIPLAFLRKKYDLKHAFLLIAGHIIGVSS